MKLAQCHPEKKHCSKGLCKSCYGKQRHKATWAQTYARNKEKIKARQRAYWHSHRKHQPGEKERAREASRRQRLKNPEKMRAYLRDWHRQKTYGLTVEQIRELFERNNGNCWICGERPAEMIDHCHKTDKVRGALCRGCNLGIGNMGDDCERVLKAAQYLKTGKVITPHEQSN